MQPRKDSARQHVLPASTARDQLLFQLILLICTGSAQNSISIQKKNCSQV